MPTTLVNDGIINIYELNHYFFFVLRLIVLYKSFLCAVSVAFDL